MPRIAIVDDSRLARAFAAAALRAKGHEVVEIEPNSLFEILRVLREDANRPQPLYLRSLLGGWSNLRGFEAGYKTGDTLVATSVEWRMPISSPLSFGKLGISLFADWGTAYEKGQRLRDQTLDRGLGGSVWLALTGFRLSVGVARGKGAGTRVNFGGGLTF